MADRTLPSSLRFGIIRALPACLPAILSAAVFLLPACNRDFSDPLEPIGLDSAGGSGDTVPPGSNRPDSVKVEDMVFTVGDAPATPKVSWYPADWPDQGYGLISDNAPVARIEAGKVRPVAAGGASITLITDSGRLLTAFLVTVKSKPKPPDPVDETIRVISVTGKPLSLLVGQEAAPVLAWNPADATDKEYALTSQDPDIAGIKGSRVVARAAGTASVVVTARDGGKTAAFTVTVQEPDNRVRVQSIAVTDLFLSPGSEASPVIAWTPSDATDKTFTLLSSDPSVAAIQGTRVRAVAPGSAVVMVQPKDDPGKAAAFKVKVGVALKGVTAPDMDFVAGDPARSPQPAFDPADATDRRYRLSSANPRVAAIVQDTLVQPLAPGESRVTLAALDGDLRQEFIVKVAARIIPVISVSVADMTLKAGSADAAPLVTWNPPDASDKDYVLAAPDPSDPAIAAPAAGLVRPLRQGVQTFLFTPAGGGQPAAFLVTVLTRLESLEAADMLLDLPARDRAPILAWNPADIEDKTFDLASSDGAVVGVNGMLLSAAGLGRAEVTVTAREGARQARFRVQVVETGCLDALEGRGPQANDGKEKKCCRDTGRLCPADPPIDIPPIDIPPIDPPPSDTSGDADDKGDG